jgi:hypothetical protein
MKKKVLYRSVIQVEVLSEEPIPEGMELNDILYECSEGAYSCRTKDLVENKEVVGKRAVKLMAEHGSDLEFFQMDSRGYNTSDCEEED